MITATTVYTHMQQAMAAQPEPSSFSFTQHLAASGLTIRIVKDRFGNSDVQLAAGPGANGTATFEVRENDVRGTERTTDEQTGAVYPDQRLFWTATWPVLRTIGLRPPAPSTPAPSPSIDPRADAIALTDRFYDVTYDGQTQLDGSLVYHLALRSRSDREAHPLTDLYVNERTWLVREAVMSFRNEEVIGGDSGTFIFDFGRVGDYWLVTHGRLDAREHYLFRQYTGRSTFVNDGFAFASPGP